MKKNLLAPIAASLLALAALATPAAAQLGPVAVTNAATFAEGFLAPGAWSTAFADFNSVGVTTATFADATPFPTTLGGVQVLVGGTAAPLSFVGPTQVNFVIPRDAATQGRVSLQVTVSGMSVYEGDIQMWPVSPGLLSINPGDIAKPGAVLNQDNTLNSAENPARPGEVVVAFGVGADFSELPDDGAPAPLDRFIATSAETKAYVSVADAPVQFSGLAPGLVNAWQLNVTVPDASFVDGQVSLQAEISGLKTNAVSFWVAR